MKNAIVEFGFCKTFILMWSNSLKNWIRISRNCVC